MRKCLSGMIALGLFLANSSPFFAAEFDTKDYVKEDIARESRFPCGIYHETETLADIKAESDLIIKAEVLDHSENILTSDKGDGITMTQVKINQILGNNDICPDVKEGDIISIAEPYYISTNSEGTLTMFCKSGYDVSTVGGEYIFFLWFGGALPEEKKGQLFSVNSVLGRYPVVAPNKRSALNMEQLSEEDVNLVDTDKLEVYKSIYKEVINEFQ